MKTETFDGVMENAFGAPLPKPISFSGNYNAYVDHDELIAANDRLSKDEELKAVNNKRKASARQAAMQAALDAAGFKKPTLEDPQVQLKGMIKILVASGRDEATATQIAEATLGIKLS